MNQRAGALLALVVAGIFALSALAGRYLVFDSGADLFFVGGLRSVLSAGFFLLFSAALALKGVEQCLPNLNKSMAVCVSTRVVGLTLGLFVISIAPASLLEAFGALPPPLAVYLLGRREGNGRQIAIGTIIATGSILALLLLTGRITALSAGQVLLVAILSIALVSNNALFNLHYGSIGVKDKPFVSQLPALAILYVAAGVSLLAVWWLTGAHYEDVPVWIIVANALLSAVSGLLFFAAVKLAGAGIATLFVNLSPFFVFFGEVLLGWLPFSLGFLLLLAVGLVGMYVILAGTREKT